MFNSKVRAKRIDLPISKMVKNLDQSPGIEKEKVPYNWIRARQAQLLSIPSRNTM